MQKPVYVIYFSICALLLVALVYTAPSATSAADSEAEAMAVLFGAPDQGGSQSLSPKRRHDGQSSFFDDPSFMGAGTGEGDIDEEAADPLATEGEEPDILEPVNKDNPVNPQTGQPYTNAAMEKFEVLRKKFPKNDLIPRIKSASEREAEAEERKKMYALQSQIAQGNSSPEDVNRYYDMQMKTYNDRKELLDYVFETMADKMDPSIKEQYEKVKVMNDQQIKQMQEQRQRALSRTSTENQ